MNGSEPTRREMIAWLLGSAGTMLLAPALSACRSSVPRPRVPLAAASEPGWRAVPEILQRIRPPVFPDRTFEITRYGARGDGTTDNTEAFRQAVAACAAAGGGHVVVPAGRFLTGPIHLRSNVDLRVSAGATVAFSQEPRDYLPLVLTRFEGVEVMNYSPLIYALDQENVGISGEGVLDGQAGPSVWWPWKGSTEFGWRPGGVQQKPARTRLFAMAEEGVPVAQRLFGEGSYLRPQFIQPYRCRNVLIEGITIRNSPMWEIHPVLCRNVTVRGITVQSLGPNNDGCDPESCRDVLIENSTFATGDDCIAIKSGRNADGRRLATPSENIIVRQSTMRDGHGGVTIGSEISGGARNIFVEQCEMSSPQLDRALRFKNNAARGGVIEDVYMRDVTVGEVGEAVLSIDFYYEEGPEGAYVPVVRHVEMQRVTSGRSKYALYLRGFPNAPITDVRLAGCDFKNVAQANVLENVRGLSLSNVTLNGRPLRV